ncbi:MAG: helix-turn-helix transcriptional regulator [Sagittula sp.]|uniref:helix-turn-helix transcriptional regulator n=1 Tax=Sagittula sp. TaxID=2038081 RepID=UPI004058A1E1
MPPPLPRRTAAPVFSPADAIAALHSSDFFPVLLRGIDRLAPFTGAFLTRLYRNRKPAHVYDTVRAERRRVVVDQYLDSAYLLDPIYNRFLKGPEDAVMRLRDVAPDRFRRSTYFKHYYGAIDLGDELALLVRLPGDSALFLSLGRPGTESRFQSREVALLQRDLPVIAALVRKHFDRPAADPGRLDGSPSLSEALEGFGAELLTAREQEIATLILKGHSSRSIAELTGTTEGTVKIHRKNLYRKLRISSQSELLAMFLGSVLS